MAASQQPYLRASTAYWVLPDHLGSTRELVDTLGKVVAHYQYDSFGVILDGRENVTRYQFTGREHDSNTDFNYHRARWYDPLTGKWLSEDPIGFAAGDANVTRYVGNGVLNATDPSGLMGHGQPGGTQYTPPKTRYVARIQAMQSAHARALYYSRFRLSSLFEKISSALLDSQFNAKFWDSNPSDWFDANFSAPALWGPTFNIMSFPYGLGAVPDETLIHESVHMIDDHNQWTIKGLTIPDKSVTEGLGYVGEYFEAKLFGLRRFESNLRVQRFTSNEQLNSEWQGFWSNLNAYMGYDVYVDGSVQRQLIDGDVLRYEYYTGIDVSHDLVFEAYRKLALEVSGGKLCLERAKDLRFPIQ